MRIRAFGAGVLLLFVAACAGTSGENSRRHARQQADPPFRPATAMLVAYAAPDGSLTRAQLEAGLRRDFDKVDKDHSGCLDPDEVRAVNEQRWKRDESTASPLIDFKQNGCVDFDEYSATARSLFDQLDRDGTGKLTAAQLKGTTKSGQSAQSEDSSSGRHRHGGGGTTSGP